MQIALMESVGDRLKRAREAAGFKTVADAARALGVSYPTYAGHENGSRGLRRDALEKYARRFKVSADWLLTGSGRGNAHNLVPLKGAIGAGGFVEAIENGDDWIEAPADAKPETVAAKIVGTSQMPMLHDGWIIYWSKCVSPHDRMNRLSVVQTADGRIMVKTIRPGSAANLFTLTSLNAPDIYDVDLDWAADIDWIKPR